MKAFSRGGCGNVVLMDWIKPWELLVHRSELSW